MNKAAALADGQAQKSALRWLGLAAAAAALVFIVVKRAKAAVSSTLEEVAEGVGLAERDAIGEPTVGTLPVVGAQLLGEILSPAPGAYVGVDDPFTPQYPVDVEVWSDRTGSWPVALEVEEDPLIGGVRLYTLVEPKVELEAGRRVALHFEVPVLAMFKLQPATAYLTLIVGGTRTAAIGIRIRP